MFVDFVASIFLFGGPLVREVIEDSLSIPLTFRVTISVDLTIHFASSGSAVGKLFYYFLNHYDGLTVCTQNIEVELDNNFSERNLKFLFVKTFLLSFLIHFIL